MQIANSNTSFSLLTTFPEINSFYTWDEHNNLFVNNNVVIKARSKQIDYPEHWGVLSLKMVLDGHESYLVDGNEYKLNENTFLILNHDQYYSSFINEKEESESLTLHFTKKFEEEIVNYFNKGDRVLDNPETPGQPEFKQTVHHFTKRMKGLKMHLSDIIGDFTNNIQSVEELFYDLYAEILYEQGNLMKKKDNIDVIKNSTRDEIFKRTIAARDYIESFYYKPDLDLNELASVSCMNRFHLLRCFKKLYGKTPYQYLKKIRFVRAHNLLQTGRYSVTDVVEMCGYNDPSSFNKSFKNTYGVNPTQL